MRTFYVILSDWSDVLQRVIAWVENPYIAISYFREYKLMDDDSEMVTIECQTIPILSQILKEEYATDVRDMVDLHLTTKTSKDNRCYVIYHEKYSELFQDDYLSNMKVATHILSAISNVMLQMIPLEQYIKPECSTLLVEVLFVAYKYTSIKQMMREGPPTTPVSDLIDIVYFWRYWEWQSVGEITSIYGSAVQTPVDAVFIDSN